MITVFSQETFIHHNPRLSLMSREWLDQGSGEKRYVEGASLAPPLLKSKWGNDSEWVCTEMDFKNKVNWGGEVPNSQSIKEVRKAPHTALPPPSLRGTRKALLIGLSYSSHGPDLSLAGSLNDVKMMQLFLEYQGWPTSSSNMKVLTDDGKGPFPTRETIVNALQWLTHGAKAGDSLFLQISGQGDSVESCLLTADCDILLESEVWDIVAAKLPKGVRLTAVLDLCQPMTLLETPKKYYYHAGGLHSKFKRPWTRPVDFVAEIVVFSPAMRLMQKELAFKNVEAGGAVCIAFIAMLLQAGTQMTYYELLLGMEEKMVNREPHGVTVQLGLTDPTLFNPTDKVTLLAEHDPMVPLKRSQFEVLLDMMPPAPPEEAEPEPSSRMPKHDLYALRVYQEYDAKRTAKNEQPRLLQYA
jgi:hypothetical protein